MSQPVGVQDGVPLKPILIIGTMIGVAVLAFAYTAGWLSPHRLTAGKLLLAQQGPGGPPLGHRRAHGKGICFTGTFESNGRGSVVSKARLFERGSYPVIGRFNLAGGDPHEPDAMAQARGLGVQITGPDGQPWRSAMLDAPVFAAPTPQAFYEFTVASASKDPAAFKKYSTEHPEILAFVGWAKNHARTESWAEDKFNSLDSFVFTDAVGGKYVVRWSYVPAAAVKTLTPVELKTRGAEFLMPDITQRVAAEPQKWELMVTVANVGDQTNDPTKAWPADRKTIDVGTLVARQIVPEPDGPCRDINYDPTVLPVGMATSDDPIPAARSAVYTHSFDSRTAESKDYPRTTTGGQQ